MYCKIFQRLAKEQAQVLVTGLHIKGVRVRITCDDRHRQSPINLMQGTQYAGTMADWNAFGACCFAILTPFPKLRGGCLDRQQSFPQLQK